MKKVLRIFLVAMLLMAPLSTTNVQAFYEVHDSDNIAQAIQQVAYQYQQIQMQMQNLSQMDSSAAAANMGQIQQNLAQLQALQQQTQSLLLNYSNFQQQWDNTYRDYSDYSGMSGADYAAHAQQMNQATQQQIYDAMKAQGLVYGQTAANAYNLQNLVNASQSAQGALGAAQAGNQIAAMQAQELLAMSNMIAQANQAQLAYQQEQKQREAMGQETTNQYFSRDGQ